jgi:hypothetical protein
MVIEFLGRKIDTLSARGRAFFLGLFQGILDGVQDGAEDLLRFALARVRKLVDALRALWQQRPDEAARLIEHAIKGLPAAERARLSVSASATAAAATAKAAAQASIIDDDLAAVPDEADDTDAAADARWFQRGHRYGQAIGHRALDQAVTFAFSKGLTTFKAGRQLQRNIRRAQTISHQLVTLSGLIKRARPGQDPAQAPTT